MPSATAVPSCSTRTARWTFFQHPFAGGREGVELAARTGGRLPPSPASVAPKGQVLVAVKKDAVAIHRLDRSTCHPDADGAVNEDTQSFSERSPQQLCGNAVARCSGHRGDWRCLA